MPEIQAAVVPAPTQEKKFHYPFKPMYKYTTNIGYAFRFFFLEAHLQCMEVRLNRTKPGKTFSIHWPHVVAFVQSYEPVSGRARLQEIGLSGVRAVPAKPYENTPLVRLPFPNLSGTHGFCGTFKQPFSAKNTSLENCQDFLDQIMYAPWMFDSPGDSVVMGEVAKASAKDPDWWNHEPYSKFKPFFTIKQLIETITNEA